MRWHQAERINVVPSGTSAARMRELAEERLLHRTAQALTRFLAEHQGDRFIFHLKQGEYVEGDTGTTVLTVDVELTEVLYEHVHWPPDPAPVGCAAGPESAALRWWRLRAARTLSRLAFWRQDP